MQSAHTNVHDAVGVPCRDELIVHAAVARRRNMQLKSHTTTTADAEQPRVGKTYGDVTGAKAREKRRVAFRGALRCPSH